MKKIRLLIIFFCFVATNCVALDAAFHNAVTGVGFNFGGGGGAGSTMFFKITPKIYLNVFAGLRSDSMGVTRFKDVFWPLYIYDSDNNYLMRPGDTTTTVSVDYILSLQIRYQVTNLLYLSSGLSYVKKNICERVIDSLNYWDDFEAARYVYEVPLKIGCNWRRKKFIGIYAEIGTIIQLNKRNVKEYFDYTGGDITPFYTYGANYFTFGVGFTINLFSYREAFVPDMFY